jgi:hypothetical protein
MGSGYHTQYVIARPDPFLLHEHAANSTLKALDKLLTTEPSVLSNGHARARRQSIVLNNPMLIILNPKLLLRSFDADKYPALGLCVEIYSLCQFVN